MRRADGTDGDELELARRRLIAALLDPDTPAGALPGIVRELRATVAALDARRTSGSGDVVDELARRRRRGQPA